MHGMHTAKSGWAYIVRHPSNTKLEELFPRISLCVVVHRLFVDQFILSFAVAMTLGVSRLLTFLLNS